MSLPDDLGKTPSLPLSQDGGPVFAAPWEARVFAMTVKAHEAGLFTWAEWTEVLGAELAKDAKMELGAEQPGYYDRWLSAFEALLHQKSVAGNETLSALKTAWAQAAKSTPHGAPIELPKTEL